MLSPSLMLHGIFKCKSEEAQDECPEYRLNLILVTHLTVHSFYHHDHQHEIIYTSKFLTFKSLLCSPDSPGNPVSQFELSDFINNCDSLDCSFINFFCFGLLF